MPINYLCVPANWCAAALLFFYYYINHSTLICFLNRMTFDTEDPELKEAYQKEITVDRSECCKSKARRSVKKEKEEVKKKEVDEKKEKELKKTANTIANVMTKLPPTIQVIFMFS